MRWKIVEWLTIQATNLSDFLLRNRSWKYQYSDYVDLPKNTIGYHYYAYLRKNKLTYKPNLIKHDIKHILLGYGMKMPGEMEIVAFLIGNKSYNKVGVLYLFTCLLIVPEYLPQLVQHYKRGKNATCLREINLEDIIDKDLTTVRIALNI
ncbi:hypothetical protein [Putridiphycobacter roseus]|nr:hypothetical protein [Putridiphycobacter roseus]